ncbi:uncharacterized protein LOC142352965 isoform X2 [Convolutriloba macropyga]|uniref:uncharacterized protein LOC142352965 isoform X2 n=1 Tax=Convolutriloba macropyga TaxID=536237 RepID=UPI003F523A29
MRFSGFFHRQESILSDNASEVSCERMKKIVEAIRNIQKLNNHLESELDRLKTRKKKETRGGKFVFPHLPKFLIRYLFPLCCAWQGTVILVITLVETSLFHDTDRTKNISTEKYSSDSWAQLHSYYSPLFDSHGDKDNADSTVTKVLMTFFQFINFVVIFMTSVKLMKQVLHRTATPLFLIQSYFATTLLFAGIYTTLEMMTKASADGTRAFIGFHGKDSVSTTGGDMWTADIFMQLTFYSISSATLCGSSDAHPIQWYSYVVSGMQVAMSFLYFSAIMGQFLQDWQANTSHDPLSFGDGTFAMKQSIGRLGLATDLNRNVYTNQEVISTFGESETEEAADVLMSLSQSGPRAGNRFNLPLPRVSASSPTSPNLNNRPTRSETESSRRHSEAALLNLNGDVLPTVIPISRQESIRSENDLDELLHLMQVNLGVMVDLIKQR